MDNVMGNNANHWIIMGLSWDYQGALTYKVIIFVHVSKTFRSHSDKKHNTLLNITA